MDLYHKYDEDRIRDAKEDIDSLLVFVCILRIYSAQYVSDYISTGWFILSSPVDFCD